MGGSGKFHRHKTKILRPSPKGKNDDRVCTYVCACVFVWGGGDRITSCMYRDNLVSVTLYFLIY